MTSPSLFPEFDDEDKKVLYIIGNGFDIAHGIKSKYSDFYHWIQYIGNQQLIDLMDRFFSNEHEFWFNIETALGEYDPDEIIEFCKLDDEIDYDHPTASVAAIEDGPDWLFKPILDDFKEQFVSWVNSIDISYGKKLKPLSTNSLYFTFNYTETLEHIYGIPESNILHIHGKRFSKNEYIFGHNNPCDPNSAYSDESELYYIQDTRAKIIRWMNEFEKNSQTIINHHQDFFTSLKDIKTVVAYGHSFNPIDWPYMEAIIKNTTLNAKWILFYYSKEDKSRIKEFCHKYELKNYSILISNE